MTIIFVRTVDCELVECFFKDVHRRLQSVDIVKNAFKGRVKRLGNGYFALEMRPFYSMFNLPHWLLRWFIKKGLKKQGYADSIVFVSKDDAIRGLLKWDK